MEKRLRSIALVLFSICCAIGFSASASALTMEKDMKASEIVIEDGMTIDGAGKYTITGGLSVSHGEDITIKNVTLDGESTQDILLSLKDAGDVVIENVTFTHYIKTGIYAEKLTNLTVTGSTFDGIDTDKLKDQSYPGNADEDLMKRSPAGMDLNFGNPLTNNGPSVTVNVESITIANNTFKNVKIPDEYLASSTGGAIKIKLKGMTSQTTMGTITIENNEFVDNARDLVIGTDSPATDTTQGQTGDLEILLVNNGAMVVKNNSGDGATETLDGNYKLNYATAKKLELNDNLYYIVNDNNYNDFLDDEDIVNTIIDDADIKGITFNVDGVSFDISSAKLESTDLDAALNDFDFQITEDTTIEALKPYQGENAFFVSFSGSELFDNGITLNTSLGESFSENLYLYYYDEENGLQLVSKSDATSSDISLSFSKSGNYVVSSTDLLGSASSETVTDVPEEVPNVPQTFDALGIYAGLGFVSVAGIAGAVIYLKRKNA